MFKRGQQVVCIDDSFESWVFDLFKALPKKGNVYTVREVQLGRSNPKFSVDQETCDLKMDSAQFDELILLEELQNPPDPHSREGRELGFRSVRFASMKEEREGVGAFAEKDERVPVLI